MDRIIITFNFVDGSIKKYDLSIDEFKKFEEENNEIHSNWLKLEDVRINLNNVLYYNSILSEEI
ncbi:hypothetical protein [Bacillus sp. V2I10]|uniref:hypothetical protein n=1 Tax=Bacillus sp. V2I10 TaxID=3042276 RepID=UPI00278B7BA2|nr:hypothetical protein [Bacillus sp. V2I10]MDQ0859851.1 hypothetical protein [Bacillus sp. V2I10]